jgi:hypothetical protein
MVRSGSTETRDGVVGSPASLGITVGRLPSSTAMHELVVPKSIPAQGFSIRPPGKAMENR